MDANSAQTTNLNRNDELTLGRSIGILTRAGADYANKQLRHHAVTLSLAAAVVLAVTIVFVFRGTDAGPQVPDLAQIPDVQTQGQPVATLTATHNATWAEGALAPGSALHPGTRLTLTTGFAEITTHRGAIAILESPATIELLDNNNALRLHSGKMVGICETESSKGFLVRTPHIDITDLGTRFGVDTTQSDATEVHVLDGEIEVKRRSALGGLVATDTLIKGQAVRADSRSTRLTRIASTNPAFATAMPSYFLPQGTGFGLAWKDTDPNWRVVAVDGQPVTDAGKMEVIYPGFGDPGSTR